MKSTYEQLPFCKDCSGRNHFLYVSFPVTMVRIIRRTRTVLLDRNKNVTRSGWKDIDSSNLVSNWCRIHPIRTADGAHSGFVSRTVATWSVAVPIFSVVKHDQLFLSCHFAYLSGLQKLYLFVCYIVCKDREQCSDDICWNVTPNPMASIKVGIWR